MDNRPTGPGLLDLPMDRRRMHFDKAISLGNIVTIASIFGGLAVSYAQFSSRISVLEVENARQRETDRRQEAETGQLRGEIREELRDIKNELRRTADAMASSGKTRDGR